MSSAQPFLQQPHQTLTHWQYHLPVGHLLGLTSHRGRGGKDTHRGTLDPPLAFSFLDQKRQTVSV